MFGPLSELKFVIPEDDEAVLAKVGLSDGRKNVVIENLSPADVRTLRKALKEAQRPTQVRVGENVDAEEEMSSPVIMSRTLD